MTLKILLARKGNQRRKFTQEGWDLLGKDKRGWVLTRNNEDLQVTNPNTETDPGADVQIVTNQKSAPSDQVVTNQKSGENAEIENKPSGESKQEIDTKAQDEFRNIAKSNLKPSMIKDFLDQAPAKKYKAKDSIETLVNLLGEKLNWNVEALKTNFL